MARCSASAIMVRFFSVILCASALMMLASCAGKAERMASPASAPRIFLPPAAPVLSRAGFPISEPGPALTALGTAEEVVSEANQVRIRINLANERNPQAAVRCLALPPDCNPRASVESVRLRQIVPFSQDAVSDSDTSRVIGLLKTPGVISVLSRGIARRSHLYRLSFQTEYSLADPSRTFSIQEAVIVISWEKPVVPAPIADAAYTAPDSPWIELLGGLALNPSALLAYADPAPPPAEISPAYATPDWQPMPAPGNEPWPWLKIPIQKDGFYFIDAKWLEESGWSVSYPSLDRLQLFAGGKEAPALFFDNLPPPPSPPSPSSPPAQPDPSAHSSTSSSSSALAPAGPALIFWGMGTSSSMTSENIFFAGPASTRSAAPIRMTSLYSPGEAANIAIPSGRGFSEWPEERRCEEDLLLETREGNFLSIKDMRRVWKLLPPGETVKAAFDLPGHIARPSRPNRKCEIEIQLYIGKGKTSCHGSLGASINGGKMTYGGVGLTDSKPSLCLKLNHEELKEKGNELTLQWNVDSGAAALFLDSMIVSHVRALRLNEPSFAIQIGDEGSTQSLQLQIAGASPEDFVAVDVSAPGRAIRIPAIAASGGQGALLALRAPAPRQILLQRTNGIARAPKGRPSPWRPWRSQTFDSDVAIITHAVFARQAEEAANLYKAEGRKPLVVDVESLYDAYTGGLQDPAAIKMFFADAFRRWPSGGPLAAILLGDCTSDYRGTAGNFIVNYVPTYSHTTTGMMDQDRYASDLWFSSLWGNDDLPDFFIGRLSASKEQDAQILVDKMRLARNATGGLWSQSVGLIADHGNFDTICDDTRFAVLPDSVLPRIADLDREPFEDNFYLDSSLFEGDEAKVSPVTTQKIQQMFEDGCSIIAFYGHGSPNIWSNQRIWFGGDSPNSDNRRLRNALYLPLVFNGTCNSGAIDYPNPPWNICISEDLMRQPGGGALGCFVPSGPGYTTNHRLFSDALLFARFTRGVRRLGSLCEITRLAYQILERPDDHARMFILLGDPLACLPPLANAQTLDQLECKSGSQGARKLRARAVSETLKDAKAVWRIFGEDGEPLLPIQTGEVSGGKALLDVDIPTTASGMIHVLCEMKSSEEKIAAGQAIQLFGGRAAISPAKVALRSLSREASLSGAAPKDSQFSLLLENRSRWSSEGQVLLERMEATPAIHWREDTRQAFQIAPHGKMTLQLTSNARPGLSIYRASLLETGPMIADELSDTPLPLAVVVPKAKIERDMAMGLLSVVFNTTSKGETQAVFQLVVGNTGSRTWPGGSVLIKRNNADLPKAYFQNQVKPGETATTFIYAPWPAKNKESEPVEFVFELQTSGGRWKDETIEDNIVRWSSPADALPDLAVREGSLKMEPENPTEGETVIVSAIIENRGKAPSPRFEYAGAAVMKDKKGIKDIPMQDRALGISTKISPALAPGESRLLQLRWDPESNLGAKSMAFIVDPQKILADPERANNRLEAPIHVRTKWKLVPKGLFVEDPRQDRVTLVAVLQNQGQSAAKYVAVAFYPDDTHTKANRLGEVLCERIEPGQTVTFRYVWHFTAADRAKPARPSFEAYIKGSMLRVSSLEK